jgi:hypothetical protein
MDRRTFLKTIGAAVAVLALPLKWAGGQIAQGRTIRVAAADSSSYWKSQADFVATGHDDQLTIQRAIDVAGPGTVIFTEGTFHISDTLTLNGNAMIDGQNRTTYVGTFNPFR